MKEKGINQLGYIKDNGQSNKRTSKRYRKKKNWP